MSGQHRLAGVWGGPPGSAGSSCATAVLYPVRRKTRDLLTRQPSDCGVRYTLCLGGQTSIPVSNKSTCLHLGALRTGRTSLISEAPHMSQLTSHQHMETEH